MNEEMSAVNGTDGARVVDEVKAAAKDVASTAKESVMGLKDQVSERASETVQTKKHALADSLESLVNALHAAEKALRDDNQESLATYASSLTQYVERSSGYIRNNDMNGLMTDLQKAGRENAGMFMGSTFVAGAALGRFLRASSSTDDLTDAASESSTSGPTVRVEGGMPMSPTDGMGDGMLDGGQR